MLNVRRITQTYAVHPLRGQDYIVGLIVSACYLAYFFLVQPVITVNNGQGWDGVDYFHMAQGDFASPVYPLVLRIGMPLLAGHFPTHDILFNFQCWNAIFALLHGVVSWLIIVAVSQQQGLLFRLMLWVLMCGTHVAPIPSAVWYPVQNDIAAALAFQIVLAMIVMGRTSWLLTGIIFFLATLCRENFPMFVLLFLFMCRIKWDVSSSFTHNIFALLRNNMTVIPYVVAALAGGAAALYVVSGVYGQSMSWLNKTLFFFNILYNHRALDIVVSFLNVCGPVFLVIFLGRFLAPGEFSGAGSENCFSRSGASLIVLAVFMLVAIGGGTNMERYMYWLQPILVLISVPVLARLLQSRKVFCLGLLVLYTLYTQRTFFPIYPAGVGECWPWSVLVGNATYTGHWAQECQGWGVLMVMLSLAVFTAAVIAVLWRPRHAPVSL